MQSLVFQYRNILLNLKIYKLVIYHKTFWNLSMNFVESAYLFQINSLRQINNLGWLVIIKTSMIKSMTNYLT